MRDFDFQRADAAWRAISLRRDADKFAALALPPLLAPNIDNAFAAAEAI